MKRNEQRQEFLISLVIIFVACLAVVHLFGCCTHHLMRQEITLKSDTTINVLRDNRTPHLQVVEVTQPTHGSTRITGDSSVSIILDKNYSGDDRFTYVVLDSSLKKKQRTRMKVKTPPPFVKEFNISLLTPWKDTSESYDLKLLIGNEVIWDSVAGAGQSWLNG